MLITFGQEGVVTGSIAPGLGLIQAITQLGALGMLTYLAVWLTRHLPGWVTTWIESQAASVKAIADAQKQQTKDFTDALKEEQQSFEARNSKVVDTFAALTREERQNFQRWHEDNRGRLERMTEEIRDNRHMLKNIAHSIGLRQAVEEEKAKQGRRAGDAKPPGTPDAS